MKKKLLSFAVAFSMVLSAPAALLAAEKSPSSPGSGGGCAEETDWAPITAAEFLEHGFITAAAPADPSIIAETEEETVVFHDTSTSSGIEKIRTISSDQPSAGIDTENKNMTLNIATADAGSDTGLELTPVKVTTGSITANRHSNTSGSASAYASFNAKASKASCTLSLQEKYNGSWRTATGVPVVTYKKSVTNSYSIAAGKTFTLKTGKVYRVKASIIDTTSSGTFTKTLYTGAF